ncbi:Dolichyl-phosphate-mannose-protein mannosyltransferase [Granulicella rosea]|uniref:Dolichyl-phosphate-mannose-protein mannosyltransferase n=1 Tax=Granulicella rosea TaxID=474952 RepID=A0A239EU56_9BACT|nr:glycosyltransferase family 39 protein [Granulicella rosea]SNS47422.1 Dolichyl-phosphate-mannose-protein mannosyltransferase [Granulicella rosea]
MKTRPQRSSHAKQTVAILALSALLRLLVLWTVVAHYPAKWLFSRGIEMGLLANSLITGHGLSSPFVGETGPTAFFGPGYPLLIAAVFRVFGSFSAASAVAIISLQILLNLITVWLVMHLARKLFDQRVAMIAGLFWACSPPLLWLPTIFWESSVSICMVTGLLALALRCREKPARALWIGIGMYCAVAVLFNPALIVTLTAIVCWLAWQTRRTQTTNLLLAVVCFAVVVAPWPIRNARVFHAFIPLRSNFGYELWMGNHPGASGYLEEFNFPTFNQTELDDYKRKGEIAYTADKGALVKQSIRQNPGVFVRLSLRRVYRFWTGTGSQGGSSIFTLHACMTSALGLVGMCLLWRRRRDLFTLLALPMLLFPLPYYITHAEFRYRLVLDPVLTVLSAYALVSFSRSIVQESEDRTPQPIEAAQAIHG